MWAESNSYYYRGILVAKTKGGALYTAPEIQPFADPEPGGDQLKFVDLDAMVAKNKTIMDALVNETIRKVYNTYMDYKNKIDVFYVAFSGGKDSITLLDIVQKALPHNSFKVLFGDTGMEFSDTYKVIEKIKAKCESEHIDFLIAKSHLNPQNTWREFGAPAQIMRWCCSVHKTAPQILMLRKMLNKPDFTGMAFTGIRGDESISRSKYDDINLGEKHKGQYSYHPLFEWNSAELFLYIYANNLIFNETYKKGNSRAGCLVCPMAANKNEFFKECCYAHETEPYKSTTTFNNLILENTIKSFNSVDERNYFMNLGGWKARRSGRELREHKNYCLDTFANRVFKIEIFRKRTSWRQWLKTVGKVIDTASGKLLIIFENKQYLLNVYDEGNHCIVVTQIETNSNVDIRFMSALKTVFRKSAYCIGCKVCEANCPYGFIKIDGDVTISDNCLCCRKCHEVSYGCLVANSLRLPKGGNNNMKSIDRYFNMGIEYDWVKKYFKEQDGFWGKGNKENDLGSKKIIILRRFLGDAGITEKNMFSPFGKKIEDIGVESPVAWALMFANLCYTSQFNWYVKNMTLGQTFVSDGIKAVIGDDMTDNSKSNIVSAFKNIFISTPLGTDLKIGICNYEEKNDKRFLIDLTRGSWPNPDARVILYGLYKFAEACGDYYQFTLTRLMNYNIDSDGVSPSQIFGIDRDTMEKLLNGLAVNYPKFISISFTLNLDNITLRSDKTSQDVLELF